MHFRKIKSAPFSSRTVRIITSVTDPTRILEANESRVGFVVANVGASLQLIHFERFAFPTRAAIVMQPMETLSFTEVDFGTIVRGEIWQFDQLSRPIVVTEIAISKNENPAVPVRTGPALETQHRSEQFMIGPAGQRVLGENYRRVALIVSHIGAGQIFLGDNEHHTVDNAIVILEGPGNILFDYDDAPGLIENQWFLSGSVFGDFVVVTEIYTLPTRVGPFVIWPQGE